jgi:Mg2+ and Co2+ transporter CorA
LEDLEARIVLFDRGLSPDEEDGKQLGRFRFSVATDLLLQKSYSAFVVQKDREARDLVDKAREFLTAIRRIFDDIRTSTLDNTRSILKTIHQYRGRNQTLGQILNGRSEVISMFLKLLDQIEEMENGS